MSGRARPLHLAALWGLCAVAAACGPSPPESSATGVPPTAAPTGSERPSILLVTLDTTRADRLGCYGRTGAATPTLDAWARQGTLFETALTPVPITLPAHASLLTGRWPHRHGVRDNGIYRLPDDVPTLAAELSGAGYATAAVVGAAVLDRAYGLSRGFGSYDDEVAGAGRDLAIAERDAAAVTDRALGVAAGLSRPFLLWVHYYDPHAAYQPPERFARRFPASLYEGEIAYVDEQLGRLRNGLHDRGLLNGTLVVVTSDHGEGLGEHGEDAHGPFLYQSTLHVPLIVAGPGWPAGARVGGTVSLTDVAPTLLAAARVEPPPGLDGTALSARPLAERWVPLESEFGFDSYGWARLAGLTDGHWKWVRAPRQELYDLSTDPKELHDLAAAEPARAGELSTLWRQRVTEDVRAAPVRDSSEALTADRLARLRALGYVAGGSAPGPGDDADLPDPKDGIRALDAINQARGHLGRREFGEAEKALERAMRISSRNTSALVLLGAARVMQGQPARAVEPLERATVLAPMNADVHFNLGLARLGAGDARGAEAAWRRTLELMPRYTNAAVNLADLLSRTERTQEAEAVVAAARRQGVADPLLDFVEGRLAAERGDVTAATFLLRRAVEAGLPGPAASEARHILGRLESGG